MLLNLIMRLYYFPMPSLVFGTTVALDHFWTLTNYHSSGHHADWYLLLALY
jgi:hypothetical protein